MCGIVGFTGNRPAAPILLEGLARLEYRGYDSAGLAVRDGEHPAEVVKAKGRLKELAEKVDGGKALAGSCGIGHTRWATHGEPSQTNAHPHVSGNCTGSGSGPVESEVVGVHNGIIENYQELRDKLLKKGYTFYLPPCTNQLFVTMESSRAEALSSRVGFSVWEQTPDGRTVIRLATSWATRAEDIDALAELL